MRGHLTHNQTPCKHWRWCIDILAEENPVNLGGRLVETQQQRGEAGEMGGDESLRVGARERGGRVALA
jgi:hypothetical protein